MRPAFLLAILLLTSAQDSGFDYMQDTLDWTGVCTSGNSQSPINLREVPLEPEEMIYVTPSNSTYIPLQLDYQDNDDNFDASVTDVTFRVTGLSGSFQAVKIGASTPTVFTLDRIEFHAPAENILNGAIYPLEMEMIHTGDDGSTAILSVWYARSATASALLDGLINDTPVSINDELGDTIDQYYMYPGSLTTPPCTEGVTWYLAMLGSRVTLPASLDQIDFFNSLWMDNPDFANGWGNNRVANLVNDRQIYHFIPNGDYNSYLKPNGVF